MARKRAHGEGTINKRKDGRWEAKASVGYKPDGTPKRHVVYGRTQAEVLEKLDRVRQQVSTGTFTDNKLTLEVYLERWLGEKARAIKPSTLEQYRMCVRLITTRAGRAKLDKLTPLQVQALVSDIQDTSGTASAAKCRTVLFSAYKQAIRWQLATLNPVEATDPVKEQHREMVLWEPEQAARFLDVAREHRLYAFFYLSMATGLRRGELLGLRWVDIEGSLLHVRQSLVKVGSGLILSTPKTRKGFRTVALSPDVLEMLLLHRQRQEAERLALGALWPDSLTVTVQKGDKLEQADLPNAFIFNSEVGTLLNPDNLKRVRDYLMTKAGVPLVRLHDLRHLHASVAIHGGMDAKVLADRLGHARASFTLDRYTHLFDSQRAKSAVNLTGWLTSERGEPN